MKNLVAGVSTLLLAAGLSMTASAAPKHNMSKMAEPKHETWTFEGDKAGQAPPGFSLAKTGGGPDGRWIVEQEKRAPSGKYVLAQTDSNPASDRMLVAIPDQPASRDLTLSVQAKAVSGKLDQDSGLVFRYRDDNNYYVARSNALKKDLALYAVKDGKMTEIASAKRPVTPGKWHSLTVVARGDHIQVLWDGKGAINTHDKTFTDAGKTGVWTKGDSVSYFDNLRLTRLG